MAAKAGNRKYIYILELCQIVYKPPEPENAMLLQNEVFAYNHVIAFYYKIVKTFFTFYAV